MIEIKNLSFSFDKPIFENLSLTIPDTGITGIVAPSGVGKTTLLNLIAGILKPEKGEIIAPEKKAFVFQDQRLLPWYSALDNIKAVVNKEESEIKKALEDFEIDPKKHPYELSGGQRQRVSLLRALLFEGDVLLLDEPFTGLDKDNREKALNMIKEYSKSKPVILVSHIKEDVESCDVLLKI